MNIIESYSKLNELCVNMIPIGKSKLLDSADYEFYFAISDILSNQVVMSSDKIMHHSKTSCYRHMFNVAYYSYKMCKFFKLDYVSAARGAMLHDLYLYTWHKDRGVIMELLKRHLWVHPKIALVNALQNFELNDIEKDIIAKHMWPVTIKLPKYAETFIVGIADKFCCVMEIFHDIFKRKEKKEDK